MRTPRRNRSGQAILEFALVAPIMMLIILGIVAFGALWSHQLTLNNASREGARHGIVCGATDEFIRSIVLDRAKLLNKKSENMQIKITPPESFERLTGQLAGDPLTVQILYDDYVAVPIIGIFTNPKRLVSVTTMRLEACPQPDDDDDDSCDDDDNDSGGDDDDDGSGECDGKVTFLKLRYNGGSSALIRVTQRNGDDIFSSNVSAGSTFSFSGTDRDGTMGTEIKLYVDNSLDTSIHTSCSQPICPGMTWGSFTMVSGESRNGGTIDCN